MRARATGDIPLPGAAALPYLLGALVLGIYTAVFVARAQQPGGTLAFAVLGTSNTPGNRGYDGQYYYRIALTPLGGKHGLDRPAYRYQRIGYPLLARLLALGRREWIGATLVAANILAIGLGTLAVGLLLRRHGLSPLPALVYALYAGQVACFWRDLAEPSALLLVALALLLLRGGPVWPAAVALLAAALIKETTLLFAAGLVLFLLLQGRWRAVLTVLALVGVPYTLWQLLLWATLGHAGVVGADSPPRWPLGGLAGARGARQLIFDLLAVALPALLCLGLAWAGLQQGWRAARLARPGRTWLGTALAAIDLPTLLVLANAAFVLWLPARSYADLWASARNAEGLVLAALAHPALGGTRLRLPLAALWGSSAPLLWLQ